MNQCGERTESGLQTIGQSLKGEWPIIHDAPICPLSDAKTAVPQLLDATAWLGKVSSTIHPPSSKEPGTCGWIFSSTTYKNWVRSGYKKCLLIQGITGQ